MDQQVSMPTASMGGSYPSNAASGLPHWTSSGEDYERLRALYAAQQRMPAMIQHSGKLRYPSHPDPTVMTTSRKKSSATKTRKQKSQISSNNAHTSINDICAQGDATTVPMYNHIPNSSGFMMPDIDGSLTMPHQPITTMHNPYLSPLPPSSMPQDHSQVVSAHLVSQHPTQQPLSHLTHPPLVVGIATSAATSVAIPISAPTQLPPLTTQGWGGHSGCSGTSTIQWTPRAVCTMNTSTTMVNKPSSSEELCLPTPIPEIPDLNDLTEADWELYIPQGSTSGQKVQAAQPVPPVSQGGILSSNSHSIACSASYCPQPIQNQKVAPASTQEVEQIQMAQQPQGAGVLCQNNILASANQAPPHDRVEGNSSLNFSEASIPTLDHHNTNSSNDESSLTTVGVLTTQGHATTNSSIVTQKSDQLPACPSPSHNRSDQSDDSDCHTDSYCKPAQVGYSPMNPIDLEIEKIDYDKELKLLHQCVRDFHRKRKLTAVLESENETTCTYKNARKDSGGEDSLVPFVLFNMKGQRAIVEELRNLKDGRLTDIAEELRNLNEGQREICEQIKNMNELLQTLSGRSQQIKMEGPVKTETQDNCMPIYALKEESNGIRLEDCCWKDENLLKIKGDDPCQYALKLLEKLFPVEDRVGKCYRRGPRSLNKPLLDEQRVKILEGNTYF